MNLNLSPCFMEKAWVQKNQINKVLSGLLALINDILLGFMK